MPFCVVFLDCRYFIVNSWSKEASSVYYIYILIDSEVSYLPCCYNLSFSWSHIFSLFFNFCYETLEVLYISAISIVPSACQTLLMLLSALLKTGDPHDVTDKIWSCPYVVIKSPERPRPFVYSAVAGTGRCNLVGLKQQDRMFQQLDMDLHCLTTWLMLNWHCIFF